MSSKAEIAEGSFDAHYDVIIVGSGAGGLAAAVTARKKGLEVLVLEKEPLYGGTTARSGGVLWVPCNALSRALGIEDSIEDARTYMKLEAGAFFDDEKVDAFLRNGPRAIDFFQRETDVQFVAVPTFPDYHPDSPGGKPGGRSILAAPFDGRALGDHIKQLRPPLKEITFVGMMFNSSLEVQHFFNVTRSARSALYVVKRLFQHACEMLIHHRPMRLTNGNALVARLAKTAFGLGVPLWVNASVRELVSNNGRVTGVVAHTDQGTQRIAARRGVVLACGGFPQDLARRKSLFPHAPTGQEHYSPAPPGNTGDGLRLAESVSAKLRLDIPHAAAWIPVSKVKHANGETGVFPHLIDRYKPGIIAVTQGGVRFVNEANSYHDFGQAMQRVCKGAAEAAAFLICDHRTIRRYGMGFAKPFPLPLSPHLRSGYLTRANTLIVLAKKMGIDGAALNRTVEQYNLGAVHGVDEAFGKGTTAYNRFLGDATHQPNPCVAPVSQAPFYALRVVMGDLGTFAGIETDGLARVLTASGKPIAGLFAVGNDNASVMGGSYPGGGITLGPALTFGFLAGEYLAQGEHT